MENLQSNSDQKLQLLYFKVTDIWKRFCEEHTELLDKTFEEYSLLLASDVNAIEELLVSKNDVMKRITFLENARERVIAESSAHACGSGPRTAPGNASSTT